MQSENLYAHHAWIVEEFLPNWGLWVKNFINNLVQYCILNYTVW